MYLNVTKENIVETYLLRHNKTITTVTTIPPITDATATMARVNVSEIIFVQKVYLYG